MNQTKKYVFGAVVLGLLCIVALSCPISLHWLTGTLGISGVVAQSIVKAVEVGSWAFFLASIAASGGIAGVGLWSGVKFVLKRLGRKAAIA